MKPDSSHIRQIKIVSNTHWDREFRRSFEKTRRRLLTMMDTTIELLLKDPAYHSFTLDGHSIMLDDYLEMRPERRTDVESLLAAGRLIAGPWYTLAEEFSIGHEALVRNFIYGRKTVEKYGGRCGTVAYTPSSWGQTGQLPQIFADFGLRRMMFYRGISHHECDAEFVWQSPDGTRMLGSRFALYARYNWYYQVHRAVTTGRVFEKDYVWGERDEVPVRFADGLAGEDLAFDLKDPALSYDRSQLRKAILDMVAAEGPHFTTEVFLAMHGHDISVAHPLESRIAADAQSEFEGQYAIEHTNLERYWDELERHLDVPGLPVLVGERRSYLKQGKWTYLMPATISARTYLKQQDFRATTALTAYAEPLASLASSLGMTYPARYMDRGWRYLLSNHTHDANGGCAPDPVCLDMEYRYRKVNDVADIVMEDAVSHVACGLSPSGQESDVMQLIVFNPLPFQRDVVSLVDVEIPRENGAKSVTLSAPGDMSVPGQPVSMEKSGSFVDSIWDVPTILDSTRIRRYARFHALPALGYRVYRIHPCPQALRTHDSLVTGPNTMANEHLAVEVNDNGTVNLVCRATGRRFEGLNYLRDQGENGNAWNHVAPCSDRVCASTGVNAEIAVVENGPLVSAIRVSYRFPVPEDYGDGSGRSDHLVDLPVDVEYRLEAGARELRVSLTVDNRASDHWLRVCFPTDLPGATSTSADSHFDVVERPIAKPDSTGWVEEAQGTHPLRTFVEVSDGEHGLALMPRGLYEYEAMEDARRTLALTLIRACRIKLAVSEEKQTELPDPGIQCPGVRRFEYAVSVHSGDWASADLLHRAAAYNVPARAVMTGRGKGTLPLEFALLSVDNPQVLVTAVKGAEDGSGTIVRFFNPTESTQQVTLSVGIDLHDAARCRMDEADVEPLAVQASRSVTVTAGPKKIVTLRLRPVS